MYMQILLDGSNQECKDIDIHTLLAMNNIATNNTCLASQYMRIKAPKMLT